MRKTKIICTIGPASDSDDILTKLIEKGMNVARLNFSHGDHEEQKKRADNLKRVREKLHAQVALLLDTKGPEIRTGRFKSKDICLEEGKEFILLNEETEGDATRCSVSYKELYQDVVPGNSILIDDGLIELSVTRIKGKDIHCKIINGGNISNNKSINVPGVKINLPSMTEKDVQDIIFGIENDFDFIAASFVRKASDVIEIKKVLETHGGNGIKVISKIENREGIQNFEEILKVSDGIMVARGDLGVEIPVEEVPVVQKSLIEKCYISGKPVITATQMLDSMIRNPRPTRAEASDVANAIHDGTSVIMLSGETAAGKFPIESLEMMVKIAEKTESSIDYWKKFMNGRFEMTSNATNAISHATCTTALDLHASAIITVTQSGHTARMISRFRPASPIIATTTDKRVLRQLSLSWGVLAFLVEPATSTDEMFDMGVKKALESGLVNNGDLVVITAGVPIGISGTTNILKVHIVGNVLVKGTGIGSGIRTGELYVVSPENDKLNSDKSEPEDFRDGDILVVASTNNKMMPLIKRASALIVEEAGIGSHAAIAGLALEIPVVVGAVNATRILKSGSVVTIDADRGIVYYGKDAK
ncbi:MAG: pyruvate kinase [Clostridiales bacterium]|nr:pyruvate kinase [Clostridiales bacterium]